MSTSTIATTGAQEPVGGEGTLMLSLLDRHKIQVLLSAGHAQKEVAQLADVSVDTVRRVAREPEVSHVDDAAHRRARAMGRFPFYFRARHEHWSFSVAEVDEDATVSGVPPLLFERVEPWGESAYDAGYMPEDVAADLVVRCAREFVEARGRA